MLTLRKQIERYIPYDEQEAADRLYMLKAIDTLECPLTRDNVFAHFTASAWIVNPSRTKVLMAWHNIYRAWAWTGGHADGDADLLRVALREAREETGIEDVRPLSNEIYALEVVTVDPHIKRGAFVSGHVHMNVTFLLVADEAQPLRVKPDENSAVAWLPLLKAQDDCGEPKMAPIYKKLNDKLKLY